MSNIPEELEHFVKSVFDASATFCEWYTVPVVFVNDEGESTFDRTGVLLEIGVLQFLITAAHDWQAIVSAGYSPFIATQRKDVPPVPLITRRIVQAPTPDIAIAHLEGETVDALREDYKFLRVADLMPRDQVNTENSLALVTGYTCSLAGRDEDGIKNVKIWRHIAGPYEEDASGVEDFNPEAHYVLEFPNEIQDDDGNCIRPNGMSGCGIWYVCEQHKLDSFRPEALKLVAIDTAWHRGRQYIKTTWIGVVLHLIWDQFADTRDPMRLYGIEFRSDSLH